jgi:Flp pilus assembly pilin Flp
MQYFMARLWRDDSAQDTSEYALLLLLITAGLAAAVITLSDQIKTVFNSVVTALTPK